MITIIDDFLDDDHYEALGNTSMVFSKVHWVGRQAESENALHEFWRETNMTERTE